MSNSNLFLKPYHIIPKVIRRSNSTEYKPLLDNHGRLHDYLRVSLTERCNLRCTYCMPEEGIQLAERHQYLNLDELKRLADIFVKLCGVKKVRLTGGEPTIDKKLVPFIEHLGQLRAHGLKTIAMTTNGLTLHKQSTTLKSLGLDAINVSLDTLQPKRFERLTRRKGWRLAHKGILSAIDANFESVKVNCVLMRGVNDDEILDFAELAEKYPLEVRFIEFMPFAGNKWKPDTMVTHTEVLSKLSEKYPDLRRLKPIANEVSRVYKSNPMVGSIGLISSMSNNFCSGCSRLRLTSDGNLKVCLFEQQETSLRDLLRGGACDTKVVEAITTSLKQKKRQHSGMSSLPLETSRPMIRIGSRMYHSSSNGDKFSHLSSDGKASMVDIGNKTDVKRIAIAQGRIIVGSNILAKIKDKSIPKGDILSVARVAGIMGAKLTSQLIPLCHHIPVDHIGIKIEPCFEDYSLVVTASVMAHHKTGVEMESLTAVSITLLTLYDMCKSVNKSMIIREVKLLSKNKEYIGLRALAV